MKPFNLNKKRIKTAAAAVICCLVMTSCWEDFDDKFTGTSETAPEVRMASNCTLTATDATLEWIEPDAVAYKGMKITCTGNGITTEATVNRGTTTYTITGLNSSYEYTITLTALYSTGYEIVCPKFSVTPTSKTLRFMYTAEDLNDVRNSLSDYCIIMADIDLSGYSSGTGWNPIGTSATRFTGIFEGNGHTIRNLTINDSTNDYKGLFGYTNGAEIKNLTLTNVSVNGKLCVGTLAGACTSGTVSNCSVTGTVSGGNDSVGGLVGYKMGGTVANCTASVTVNSTSESAGGLIGHCENAPITNCHATGSVKGTSSVGGLVGYAGGSTSITNCFATGNVLIDASIGNEANAGGLVGLASLASITQKIEKCYALGDVTAQYPGSNNAYAGGLVGWMRSSGSIVNCFARGNVDANITNSGSTAPVYAGGLVGRMTVAAQYCFSTGSVGAFGYGTVNIKGFACQSVTVCTACYYDITTSGITDDGVDTNGIGKAHSDMILQSTYQPGTDNWDFGTIWAVSGSVNNGYPYLTGMVP